MIYLQFIKVLLLYKSNKRRRGSLVHRPQEVIIKYGVLVWPQRDSTYYIYIPFQNNKHDHEYGKHTLPHFTRIRRNVRKYSWRKRDERWNVTGKHTTICCVQVASQFHKLLQIYRFKLFIFKLLHHTSRGHIIDY